MLLGLNTRQVAPSLIVTWTLFFLSFPLLGNAGVDKGNGGDGFYCPLSTPKWRIAEEVETFMLFGLSLKMPGSLLDTPDEIAKKYLKRLEFVFPKFYLEILTNYNWVKHNWVLVYGDDVQFINLDDDLLKWIPDNCSLEQVAYQTLSEVLVLNRAWTQMAPYAQAMLITHEVIYRTVEQIANKNNIQLKDSRGVRYLNSIIWSNELPNLKTSDISSALLQLGAPRLL